MTLKKIFLSFLLCLPLGAFAQNKQASLPVHVTVVIKDQTDDKNLILYNKGVPLTISNFKGRPDMTTHGVGATYSGILMETKGQSQDGVLEVTVYLTVYYDKMKSWMKEAGKNDRVLAHEQRHFDLTAIKACALAKAISEAKLTQHNVSARIRELQQQHTRELNELQQQYDAETEHGTIPDQQEAWNKRIDKGLAASACL